MLAMERIEELETELEDVQAHLRVVSREAEPAYHASLKAREAALHASLEALDQGFTLDAHQEPGDDGPLLDALDEHERWAHQHADYPGERVEDLDGCTLTIGGGA